MKMKIRKITLKDITIFFEFFQKTVSAEFPEYTKGDLEYIFTRGWSKKNYKDWLKNKERYILGAFNDGKLIAFLDAKEPELGVCYCNWIMVDKKHQKKGIGTNLLSKLEKDMKNKGAHMIFLYAGKQNIPYYKKIGYKWVGNMKKSWLGQDHHILTKLIQKPTEENYLL